jgi:hypothetical protein
MMSEYQYHEWQTIDRLLTPEEQASVNRLSSHIDVSPSRAVVTYDWGDFKHDPKEVLLQYFDAYFYLANWGSRRLMFRFPKGILNPEEIKPYCDGDFVSFETIGEHQVLDIDFNPDDDGEWIGEADGRLSYFTSLRDDLLQGDFRLLYLAWLKAMTYEAMGFEDKENEEYDLEPPVPPGLQTLSPALQNFMQVFDIDPFLVGAAAENSPDLNDSRSIHYRDLVSRLPRSEADDFLTRMAEGDAGVRLSLRKRLNEFIPKGKKQAAQARPLQQLLTRAEQLEKAEKERKAQEARRKHISEMKALAQKEGQVWAQVDDLLENGRKIASVYNEATGLLEKLKQLADFQDTRDFFYSNIRVLAGKYGSRPSLMERWKKHGWL